MKNTFLRTWTGGFALLGLVLLSAGCEEEKDLFLVPLFAQTAPAAKTPATEPIAPAQTPVQPVQEPSIPDSPPALVDSEAPPSPIPNIPDQIDASKPLADIVKLVQSGISEEVMLSYIQSSTNHYGLTSDDIVYLNDLGISTPVIQALIEKYPSAEAIEQQNKAESATALPPGVALTEPATGIYPAADPGSDIVQVPKFPAGYPEDYMVSQVEETPAPPPVQEYLPPEGDTVPTEAAPFYEALSPYGSWYNVPEYGYVWQPTVSVVQSNWRPYADSGRWLWSSSGWYWYSDYSWGWAPFHYGRWTSYPRVGWVWVPGQVWGPSWVSWRYSNYYAGWAPLPPRCNYVSGFGLYYNNSSVSVGFGFGWGYDYYTYIPINRFCDYRPYHYYVRHHHHKKRIYKDTKPHNRYSEGKNRGVVNQGISRDRIARSSRSGIPRVEVRDAANSSRLDATGRRERLVSERGNLSVTRATPPSVTRSGPLTVARRSQANPGSSGSAATTSQASSSQTSRASLSPARGSTRNARSAATPGSSRDSRARSALNGGSAGGSRARTVRPSTTVGSPTVSRARTSRQSVNRPAMATSDQARAGTAPPPVSRVQVARSNSRTAAQSSPRTTARTAPQSSSRASVSTARPQTGIIAQSRTAPSQATASRTISSRSSRIQPSVQATPRGTQIRSTSTVNPGTSRIVQSPRSPGRTVSTAAPSLNRSSTRSYRVAPSRSMVSPRTTSTPSRQSVTRQPSRSPSRSNISRRSAPASRAPVQQSQPRVQSSSRSRSVNSAPPSRSRSVAPSRSSGRGSNRSQGSSSGRGSRR